jgi:hypothetical protein
MAQQAQAAPLRRSNKRMHATALQRASHVRCAGRRVMRGVRRLVAKHEDQKFGPCLSEENSCV